MTSTIHPTPLTKAEQKAKAERIAAARKRDREDVAAVFDRSAFNLDGTRKEKQ